MDVAIGTVGSVQRAEMSAAEENVGHSLSVIAGIVGADGDVVDAVRIDVAGNRNRTTDIVEGAFGEYFVTVGRVEIPGVDASTERLRRLVPEDDVRGAVV